MRDERSYAEVAKDAVDEIIADLSDRGGLSNAWDDIDGETQNEIREEWKKLVLQAMGVEV